MPSKFIDGLPPSVIELDKKEGRFATVACEKLRLFPLRSFHWLTAPETVVNEVSERNQSLKSGIEFGEIF